MGNLQYSNRALNPDSKNLNLQADDQWAHIWTGRAYARLEKYDEAEKEYKKSMEINPGFIQSYISLGDLAVQLGEKSLAVDYYRQALKIEPLHESVRSKIDKIGS